MSIFEKLRELDANSISLFNLENNTFIGKIVHVFNASYCEGILIVNNIFFKFLLELDGIDNYVDDEYRKFLINETMDVNILGVETEKELDIIEHSNTKLVKIKCTKFLNLNKLKVVLYNIDKDENSINYRIQKKINI